MQTTYLVTGSTGAGKTTYARKLGSDLGAQVFSIDEWMGNLFWMDAPPAPDPDWAMERVRRCEEQVWLTARRLLDAGVPVVLDLGFSRKEQRVRFKSMVSESGHASELHYLDVPVETRRLRVHRRNMEKSGTFEFEVDDRTFEWMESFFENPDRDELRGAVIVSE